MSRGRGKVVVLLALAGSALALPGAAAACVCPDTPLSQRFDEADAAVVGKVVREQAGESNGVPQRVLTVEVDQEVKGDVGRAVVVRSPSGTDCDVTVPRNETTGFLLSRGADGRWLVSACSIVAPGPLVAEGGEPRGGAIKVAVGLVLLALVLLWALRRLRKGSRPSLPGAPGT